MIPRCTAIVSRPFPSDMPFECVYTSQPCGRRVAATANGNRVCKTCGEQAVARGERVEWDKEEAR